MNYDGQLVSHVPVSFSIGSAVKFQHPHPHKVFVAIDNHPVTVAESSGKPVSHFLAMPHREEGKHSYIFRVEVQDPTGKKNLSEFAFSVEYTKAYSSSPVASSSGPHDAKAIQEAIKPFDFSRPLDLTNQDQQA